MLTLQQYISQFPEVCHPNANYIHVQPDIDQNIRAILVIWLTNITKQYEVSYETLFLSVCILDRFLAACTVSRKSAQSVAAACLSIAAKLHEKSNTLLNVVDIYNNCSESPDLGKAEIIILKAIGFKITCVTPLAILNAIMRENGIPVGNSVEVCVASLIHYSMHEYDIVTLAFSCILTAYKDNKEIKHKIQECSITYGVHYTNLMRYCK